MCFAEQLDQLKFEQYTLSVTIATIECGGVTSNPRTYHFLAPVDAWGFPKYPSKTIIVAPTVDLHLAIRSFVITHLCVFGEPNSWFGTWINPQTQHCYLDITTSHTDLSQAQALAQQISQREGPGFFHVLTIDPSGILETAFSHTLERSARWIARSIRHWWTC
jgi:hypothetical protein